MKFFITGGAGFIGSSLSERLASDANNFITIYDNFSSGQKEFIQFASGKNNVAIIEGDILDEKKLSASMRESEFVFHFAANADVRFGLEHPRKDLEQNTIGTFNVLEAMRGNDIKKIAFSSTGSVYGEASVIPAPEDCPFPVQTSLYASSKLAGEALISSYCEGFAFTGYIFRFVSILGERYTHGHIFDFYKQLLEHPDELNVLGDGTQRKSYLYIDDCINAILSVTGSQKSGVNIYNLGTDEYCTVRDSIGWICSRLALNPRINFSGGKRGWVGDNPFIFLDTRKIRSTGWKANLSIREAVIKTVEYLAGNRWIYDKRK